MSRNLGITMLVAVCCAGCSSKGAAQGSKDTAVAPLAQITVVGCVQPADRTAANASGTNDTTYMLTHAKSDNGNPNASTGTSGSSSGSQPAASTYRLDASDATLSPDVGHQVEIVAVEETLEPAPAGTTGTVRASAPAPKLKVEAVKMIAVPCPE